jgi:hypothetical protein
MVATRNKKTMSKKKNSPGMASKPPTRADAPAQAPSPAPASPRKGAPAAVWALGGLMALMLVGALALLMSATSAKPITPTATPRPTRPARAGGTVDYCRALPKFRDTLGFGQQAAMSTLERGVMGAVMVEPAANSQVRAYQHPTWKSAGYLGHVVFDRKGDVYTFPAPYVSLIDNPPEKQNMIYRIDGVTAVMTPFLTLPSAAPTSDQNPFGVMGLVYDCDTNSLYASSVAGSARDAEVGRIYRIDMNTGKIASTFDNLDVFGMGIYMGATGKRLYFGSARTAEVYSVAVNEDGDLVGDTKLELSIPDQNYKARRIIFDRNGGMQVRGYPFDFTLVVTSERNEKIFNYALDAASGKWKLVATP